MEPTDYESAVIEFLKQPDNLKYALEMGERIGEVKKQVRLQFWNSLRSMLLEKLGAIDGWNLTKMSAAEMDARLPGFSVVPEHATSLHLRPSIEYQAQVYYGIALSKQSDLLSGIVQVETLKKALKDQGHYYKESNWWISYKNVGIALEDRATILRINESNTLQDGLATSFSKLFLDNKKLIEDANSAISYALDKRS